MSIVWEGKHMRNILTIIHYEYKAHIMRIATWGVFAAGVFFPCWMIFLPEVICAAWNF